jgi:hypothetical protein
MEICIGQARDNASFPIPEDLRTRIISAHFNKDSLALLQVNPPITTPITYSLIDAARLTYQHHRDLALKTIKIVAMWCLANIGMAFLCKKYLLIHHEFLRKGAYLYASNDHSYLRRPIRKYNTFDLCTAYFSAGMLWAIASWLIAAPYWHKANSLLNIFRCFSQLKYTKTVRLESHPTPIKAIDLNSLANSRDNEGFIDPITSESIPEGEIRSAQIALIGTYALSIKGCLKFILQHPLNPQLRHPIENRAMTETEQENFLNYVATFFCISKEKFLHCWNVDIKADIPPNFDRKKLFTLVRTISFLELLSQTTVRKELKNFLLYGLRELTQALIDLNQQSIQDSGAPSLLFAQIFGADFPEYNLGAVHRVLELS